ncbi:Large ribosomal RNA subunit accumulation protein YceD [Sporomusa termitida]|uniref:Large ribosomal RNA subunit accumulation protein YceD n=2 Tax=Sporomusa termitida TaxID=2377 RepID=A0A517DSV2_9FIRM|nr:Large ribosomal RNA subunit accumulation protein YceD [Sporomusa termitida]
MKINVSQLKKNPGTTQAFSCKTSAGELGLDQPEVWTENMMVDGCVVNKGMIYAVSGEIRTTLNQCCSCCLEDMVTSLTIAFSEEYKEAGPASGDALALDINYFNGDEIDITDLVRENLLLAEPIKPVCSASCRGLCPECGVNLNTNTCGCNPVKVDPRLAVLEKLLVKD